MKRMLTVFCGILLGAATQLGFSQELIPTLGPAMAPPAVAPVPPGIPLQFNNVSEVYRYIVQTRGLGRTDDEALMQALTAGSTVQQVKDISGELLTVIKPELIVDGTSRLASNGNYPYYVLRPGSQGLALLGTMFGQGYATSLTDGHLRFTMRLRTEAGKFRPMRFEVRGNSLVNLSPLNRSRRPIQLASR
jgi:hypothetical protein